MGPKYTKSLSGWENIKKKEIIVIFTALITAKPGWSESNLWKKENIFQRKN
jgi:hypothetical protein